MKTRTNHQNKTRERKVELKSRPFEDATEWPLDRIRGGHGAKIAEMLILAPGGEAQPVALDPVDLARLAIDLGDSTQAGLQKAWELAQRADIARRWMERDCIAQMKRCAAKRAVDDENRKALVEIEPKETYSWRDARAAMVARGLLAPLHVDSEIVEFYELHTIKGGKNKGKIKGDELIKAWICPGLPDPPIANQKEFMKVEFDSLTKTERMDRCWIERLVTRFEAWRKNQAKANQSAAGDTGKKNLPKNQRDQANLTKGENRKLSRAGTERAKKNGRG